MVNEIHKNGSQELRAGVGPFLEGADEKRGWISNTGLKICVFNKLIHVYLIK